MKDSFFNYYCDVYFSQVWFFSSHDNWLDERVLLTMLVSSPLGYVLDRSQTLSRPRGKGKDESRPYYFR